MADQTDVVVIGAGAAGLMAAIRAAERGKRTLLLEKNSRAGVKILMSGGTRCNITQNTDNRGIVKAYGPPGQFLYSALAAFGVEDTVQFFHDEGVLTKVEETGKIFPVSNQAADVLNALLRRLHRSGAELALSDPVLSLERRENGFIISTTNRTLRTGKAILTSGGQSYPGSGTTGDGYAFARKLGHTIVPPRPALVPLRVTLPWVAELRGITLPDVGAAIVDTDGQPLSGGRGSVRRGSLLFAHFGLSGPVILDLSRIVTGHPNPTSLMLELDLVPALADQVLGDRLRDAALAEGKKMLAAIVPDVVPRRLAEAVVEQAGMPRDRKAAGLSKVERGRLVLALKRLRLPLSGALGFEKAEVTAGGVSLDEVDSRTMVSKLVPGLHFAGEVLDLDGPIGGYNFQAAWSTGWLAGGAV